MAVIDRRDFLRAAGAITAPSLLRAQARPPATRSAPIVVVGAGLAGLRAAQRLQEQQQSVVVLEATDRPGGRVRTLRSEFTSGLYGEAGPIRIHASHRRVIDLAQQLGLTLVPFASDNGAMIVSINGVRVRPPDEIDRLASVLNLRSDEQGLTQAGLLEKYVGSLPASMANPDLLDDPAWAAYDRVSWPEWLRSRGASEGAVKLMTVGGDSSALSALYVLRQYALIGVSELYKIQGGMDLLPRRLAARLGRLIRYNAPVTRVEPNADGVRVEHGTGSRAGIIVASRVILAIPFSTLSRIATSSPALRARWDAAGEVSYYPATRCLVQCRTRFWHEQGLSGAARTDRPAELWDGTYDVGGDSGVLGATLGGELGERLAKQPRAEATASGIRAMADAFPSITGNVDRAAVYRWPLDPWARGAFAVFRPGQMTRIMPATTRPEGRVHFAGEQTAAWMAWMEGALQSGDRVAGEVLA